MWVNIYKSPRTGRLYTGGTLHNFREQALETGKNNVNFVDVAQITVEV